MFIIKIGYDRVYCNNLNIWKKLWKFSYYVIKINIVFEEI